MSPVDYSKYIKKGGVDYSRYIKRDVQPSMTMPDTSYEIPPQPAASTRVDVSRETYQPPMLRDTSRPYISPEIGQKPQQPPSWLDVLARSGKEALGTLTDTQPLITRDPQYQSIVGDPQRDIHAQAIENEAMRERQTTAQNVIADLIGFVPYMIHPGISAGLIGRDIAEDPGMVKTMATEEIPQAWMDIGNVLSELKTGIPDPKAKKALREHPIGVPFTAVLPALIAAGGIKGGQKLRAKIKGKPSAKQVFEDLGIKQEVPEPPKFSADQAIEGLIDRVKTEQPLRGKVKPKEIPYDRQSQEPVLRPVGERPELGQEKRIPGKVGRYEEIAGDRIPEVPEIPEKVKPTPKAVKEPWEMTGSEFVLQHFEKPEIKAALAKPPKRGKAIRDITIDNISKEKWLEHESAVKQALSEDKPVSPEVLKDYPDLAPKSAEKPMPRVETPQKIVIGGEGKKIREHIEKKKGIVPEEKLPTAKIPQKPVPKVKKLPEPELPKTLKLNKVETDKLRELVGLEKLPKHEKRKWMQVLETAKVEKYNERALEVADEVIRSKRPLDDVEHAGMVIKAAELSKEFDTSIKEINRLVEKNDIKAVGIERLKSEAIIDQIDKLTEGTRLGRREVARALSIGRMLINREDYSIAKTIQRARAAKTKKLDSRETKQFEKLVSEHTALEEKVKILESNFEKMTLEREKLIAERIAIKKIRKNRISKTSADKKEIIRTERENIKKQIAEMGIRVNDITGIAPEAAYLVGKLAVNYIKEGAATLDAVVKKVLVDLPELTESDVYRSLITKDPKLQRKARSATAKNIMNLKKQAQLLVDIEKAEAGIFEKTPKKKTSTPSEIMDLQSKLRELRTQAYKSPMKSNKLERALNTINELQDQLDGHYRNIKKQKPVESPELKSTRDKIKYLRKLMRTEDMLTNLNEQLKTGDFEVKRLKPALPVDPRLERAQIGVKVARRNIRNAISDLAPVTARGIVRETANTLRTLKATADMSYTFRQGLILSIMNPGIAIKSFKGAFKATFNKYKAEQIDNFIRSASHHYIREKSNLFLADIGGRFTRGEEMFMSQLAEKIPAIGAIVKASERHMVTGLNLLRTGVFDEFLAKYPNATHKELLAWANCINVFSGRGDLGKLATVGTELSTVVFAPRFAASRVQTPYMIFKYMKEPRVRKEIARHYVGIAGMGMSILALADIMGAEVGLNPREADFGKIRIGDTRIDIWGGIQQPMRLIARTGIAATDKAGLTGKWLNDREKEFNPLDAFGRFAAYKLAPSVTVPLELYTGKTIVGEEVTLTETMARSVMPMVYEDIYEAYKREGLGMAAGSGALNFFGASTNTYEDSEYKTRRDIKYMFNKGNSEGAYQRWRQWNIKHPDRQIINIYSKKKK